MVHPQQLVKIISRCFSISPAATGTAAGALLLAAPLLPSGTLCLTIHHQGVARWVDPASLGVVPLLALRGLLDRFGGVDGASHQLPCAHHHSRHWQYHGARQACMG